MNTVKFEKGRVIISGASCRWTLLEEPRSATKAERAKGAGRTTALGVHRVALAIAEVTSGPCAGARKRVLLPLSAADCLAFEMALAGRG